MDEEAKRTMRIRAHASLALTLEVKKFENVITKLALDMTPGDVSSPEELWNAYRNARLAFNDELDRAMARVNRTLVWMSEGQGDTMGTDHRAEQVLRRWEQRRVERRRRLIRGEV